LDGQTEPPPQPALVNTLKAKPTRQQKGTPKGHPGKLSWVHGTERKFFERRKEDWLRESEKKRVSTFYTKMAKLFIKKYGRNIRDDQDLAEDIADLPDEAANKVVHKVLTKEEQAFRADHLKSLRSVRTFCSPSIELWLNYL
jgi:hypothetical protein